MKNDLSILKHPYLYGHYFILFEKWNKKTYVKYKKLTTDSMLYDDFHSDNVTLKTIKDATRSAKTGIKTIENY